MSSAALVPITHHPEGDDAVSAISQEPGAATPLRARDVRFRYADGFSHARALAFELVLAVIPALITVVALARLLDQRTVTEATRLIEWDPKAEIEAASDRVDVGPSASSRRHRWPSGSRWSPSRRSRRWRL